jgi:hypothetical protein
MNFAERKKWEQIKKALEAAGKTDCNYYRLALAALSRPKDFS